MGKNKIEKFIIVILAITTFLFLALWQVSSYVCASENDYSCNHEVTPPLSIPSNEYLPSISPTDIPTPTFIPSETPVQPTLSPTVIPSTGVPPTVTPVAGSSAVVTIPTSPPDTGRAN